MKRLLEAVIKALVDEPDQIRIAEVVGAKTCIYDLRCSKKDVGKVIGKSGKTVSAIRTLLNAVAARSGRRAVLEVVE